MVPTRQQANIWTSYGILLIVPLETNICEITIEVHISLLTKNAFETVVYEL